MAQFINPCGPQPERCRTATYPLFSTGISVRPAPQCGPVYCDCDSPSIGRFRISAGGTLDRTRWLEGWIYAQLVTRGEVQCEDHTLRKRDGGWWADAFREPANSFKTGSKLWSLKWSFVNNEALILAKAYATEALTYLVKWGIASRIEVDATYVSRQCMRLSVFVTGPGRNQADVTIDGQALPNGGWVWGDYTPEARRGQAAIGPEWGLVR